MRFRTLALAIAMVCGLTAGAEAKKKTSHSTPATAKRTHVKKLKSNAKRHKVKPRKVAKAHKVNR